MRRKRFLPPGCFIAQCTRKQSRNRLDNDGCAQFATAQHVVAYRNLAIGKKIDDAFIDAFVAAADQHDPLQRRQFSCQFLREPLALRGEHNYALLRRAGQAFFPRR